MGLPMDISPANANATQDVGKLLRYVTSLPQRKTRRLISGQQIGDARPHVVDNYDKFIVGLHEKTGQWPAMIGADYDHRHGADKAIDRSTLNPLLIDYWNAGGLVTICCHACNPWSRRNAWLRNKKTGQWYQAHDLRELTNPGCEAHHRWIAQLDDYATGLATLRDAGVTVLWRPFHEMTGNWFWWGSKAYGDDASAFIDLWRHMFHYFSEVHKLNNLIWVYTASNQPRPRHDICYPGDGYTDIVGEDIYHDEVALAGYDVLTKLPKPFCMGEFGPTLPTPGPYDIAVMLDWIKRRYPLTTSWLSWPSWNRSKDGWQYVAIVECVNAETVMNDPWVISRDTLTWRQRPTASGDQTRTG